MTVVEFETWVKRFHPSNWGKDFILPGLKESYAWNELPDDIKMKILTTVYWGMEKD